MQMVPIKKSLKEQWQTIPCKRLPMSRSVQPEGAPAARTPCNATDVDKKMLAFLHQLSALYIDIVNHV